MSIPELAVNPLLERVIQIFDENKGTYFGSRVSLMIR